jgi:hypothetical protein
LRNADVVYTPNVLQDTLMRMQMRHALVTGICNNRDITSSSIFALDDVRDRARSAENDRSATRAADPPIRMR